MAKPTSFTIIIPGDPKGKPRPRVVRGGQHTYTPKSNFYHEVQKRAEEAGIWPYDGPVQVAVSITRRLPISWSKKKHAAQCGHYAIGVPDVNNVMSNCFDALKGIAYADDRQVASCIGVRRWVESVGETRIDIRYLPKDGR